MQNTLALDTTYISSSTETLEDDKHLDSQLLLSKDMAVDILETFQNLESERLRLSQTIDQRHIEVDLSSRITKLDYRAFAHNIPERLLLTYTLSIRVILNEPRSFEKIVGKKIVRQTGSRKTLYKMLYILRPSYNGAIKAVQWYLNVSCNPTALAGVGPDKAIELNENQPLRQQMINMYSAGYHLLEIFAKMGPPLKYLKDRPDRPTHFKWDKTHFEIINAGQLEMRQVSFSQYFTGLGLYRDRLWNQLRSIYINSHIYKQDKEFNFSKWFDLESKHVSPNADERFKEYIEIKKRYADRMNKFVLRIYKNTFKENGTKHKELKMNVTLFPRFLRNGTTEDMQKKFTIAQFIKETVPENCKEENAYLEHKKTIQSKINFIYTDEIYMVDMTTFDAANIVRYKYAKDEIINPNTKNDRVFFDNWIKNGFHFTNSKEDHEMQKLSLVNTGTRKKYGEPLTIREIAVKFSVGKNTVDRVFARFRERGINMKIPYPAYNLIAKARIDSFFDLDDNDAATGIAAGLDTKQNMVTMLKKAYKGDSKSLKKIQTIMAKQTALKNYRILEQVEWSDDHMRSLEKHSHTSAKRKVAKKK